MEWWNDNNIKKMYAVGQSFIGKSIAGQQVDGWMCEGIFETEQEAIDNCIIDDYFVTPLPVGMLTGTALPDGMFWPKLQTKEEGQERMNKFRLGLLDE